MCYPAGEFRVGAQDLRFHRGERLLELPPLAGAAGAGERPAAAREIGFWMSGEQFRAWAHTHLTIDAVPGRGSGFSLEAPEGLRFLTRSRLL